MLFILLPKKKTLAKEATDLKSLNLLLSDIDKKWASLATERLSDLKSEKGRDKD
jgi:hypothetical protein